MRRSIWLSLALGLALAGARSALATDYWDVTAPPDSFGFTQNELIHGTSQQHDLQTIPGPVADDDWYIVINSPRSSYEAVVDSPSQNIHMYNLTNLARFDIGGSLLQVSEFATVGATFGYSTALRWQNTGTTFDQQYLRVQSQFCAVSCLASDQYHIRFYETTVSIPRFNNASGQVTVLIIQNSTSWTRDIAGTAYFHNAAGTLLGSTTFSLAANAALVLNTATVPGVAGVGGTIKVAHDGGYGNLAMKAVALEPATGFSFDSPMGHRPR